MQHKREPRTAAPPPEPVRALGWAAPPALCFVCSLAEFYFFPKRWDHFGLPGGVCHREPPEPCSDGPPAVPKTSELQPELSARPRAGEQRRWKPREPAVTPLGRGEQLRTAGEGAESCPDLPEGFGCPGRGCRGGLGAVGTRGGRAGGTPPSAALQGPSPGTWCQGCSLGTLWGQQVSDGGFFLTPVLVFLGLFLLVRELVLEQGHVPADSLSSPVPVSWSHTGSLWIYL